MARLNSSLRRSAAQTRAAGEPLFELRDAMLAAGLFLAGMTALNVMGSEAPLPPVTERAAQD